MDSVWKTADRFHDMFHMKCGICSSRQTAEIWRQLTPFRPLQTRVLRPTLTLSWTGKYSPFYIMRVMERGHRTSEFYRTQAEISKRFKVHPGAWLHGCRRWSRLARCRISRCRISRLWLCTFFLCLTTFTAVSKDNEQFRWKITDNQ